MIGRFELYQDPDDARHTLGLDRWPWDEHTVEVEPFDSPDALRAARASSTPTSPTATAGTPSRG